MYVGMARLRVGILVALFSVLAGCGQEAPPPPADRAYTVEELAEKVGCTPEFQGRTSDFRQAACATDATRYMLLDFTTDEKKRTWLDTALIYGATYLVGERWALTSIEVADMERLRGEIGGSLEGDPTMQH
ncbi:MAG: hypothetical protein WBA97_23670 [Actinophytocola sp.]